MKARLLCAAYVVTNSLMLLSAKPALAAELRHGVNAEGRGFYVLSGEIARGDAQKLIDLIHSDLYSMATAYGLLIDSQGGDVAEAIRISEVVEHYWLPVEVSSDGECSSACFYIYVAAPHRGAYGAVRIHAPYFDLSGVDQAQYADYALASRQAHEVARTFLLARSVPSDLIEKMLSLPSTSTYTLSSEDRLRVGFESAFAREVGAQRCGGLSADRVMTLEEVRRYRSCTNMVFLEARLSNVWGDQAGIARTALADLGAAFRERVMPSSDYSYEEKLRMQEDLGSIVTRLPPGAWVEAFDRYLKSKGL